MKRSETMSELQYLLVLVEKVRVIYKQNLTEVAKQVKHNCPPVYNIPSVSPVIHCRGVMHGR